MVEIFKHCFVGILMATGLNLYSSNVVAAGPPNVCPDSEYFSGLVNDVCWSCALPISLFGLTDPPDGANTDFLCACEDDLGIPIPGFSVGFYSPDQILEASMVPWCSPTLGGTQLVSDYTHIGTPTDPKLNGAGGKAADTEGEQLAQWHYNYLSSPVMKMLGILAIPECDKTPGVVDMDIMFMSPVTLEWYDDLMSFIINPDSAAFASPIGQAICIADCVETMTTGKASEINWHCSGCDGSLYPLTGNVTGAANNPIQATSLITSRAIAKSHRLGLSAKTMGKDAMCEFDYTPTIPKSQYKLQLSFPIPQGSGECCQPLGQNYLMWGLGRQSPGGGKDSTFVYNIFRWSDCCIPML